MKHANTIEARLLSYVFKYTKLTRFEQAEESLVEAAGSTFAFMTVLHMVTPLKMNSDEERKEMASMIMSFINSPKHMNNIEFVHSFVSFIIEVNRTYDPADEEVHPCHKDIKNGDYLFNLSSTHKQMIRFTILDFFRKSKYSAEVSVMLLAILFPFRGEGLNIKIDQNFHGLFS